MKWVRTLPLIVVLVLLSRLASGQQTYQLEFDETGRLLSAPPAMMEDGDQLKIVLHAPESFLINRLITVHNLYANTIKTLGKTDPKDGSYTFLKTWNIPGANSNLLLQLRGMLASQLIKLDQDPKYKVLLKKQIDPDAEVTKMTPFLPDTTKVPDKLTVPDYQQLMNIKFNFKVKVVNFNGLPGEIICDQTAELDTKKDTCCQVNYVFKPFTVSGILTGPIQYSFELRQNNPTYDAFIALLNSKNSKALSDNLAKIDLDALTGKINSILAFEQVDLAKIKDSNLLKDLKDYIGKKEAGKDDTVKRIDLSKRLGSVKSESYIAITASLNTIPTLLQPLKSTDALAWLFQSLWLSSGTVLTANPLVVATSPAKEQADASAKVLKTLQQDSVQLVQKTALIENISKTNLQKGDLNILVLKNDSLAKLKLAKQVSVDSVRAIIAKLQAQQKKDNQQAQQLKNSTFQDSLFYQGLLIVNHQHFQDKFPPNTFKEWWLSPNLYGFAFMRHHDALQDFQLMGKKPVLQINEKQRIYILIENSNKNAKYALKTTITAIKLSDDIGPLAEISGNNNGTQLKGGAAAGSDDPATSIYNTYETVKTQAAQAVKPFQNGILTLPVTEQKDQTPNYMTRLVSHEEPFISPASVTYEITDSASAKNLNSEQTKYSYRFNKLYRFRFKAGMVYSWLEKDSYTITGNSATLTRNYTNLAPAFGLQIFTAKIDVQSNRFLPTGIYPFLYLGYLYSDASANNFLLGGGFELYSGIAISGGWHLGKSQELTLSSGNLGTRDIFKSGGFISLSIGLEAFNAFFNTTKPANPFK